MIVKHHYSHTWTMCRYALGIFYETDNEHSFFDAKDEKLAGVCVYGYPVGRSATTSISPELKSDEVLELTRLFIFDDYGKNRQPFYEKFSPLGNAPGKGLSPAFLSPPPHRSQQPSISPFDMAPSSVKKHHLSS